MFWIDIEDAAGNRYSDGPLVSALEWTSAGELSLAGTFSFRLPASDPRSAIVQARRVARCWMATDDGPREMGAGVIETIGLEAGPDGNPILAVSGDDLLRELIRRQVGSLVIDDGGGGPTTTGPALVMALAPTGWTITGSSAVSIVHAFEGETVLNALVRLAEMTGERFRLGTGRQVVWMSSNDASGKTLIYGLGAAASDEMGTITKISQEQDSHDKITRVYPYGVGSGDNRVTLATATWTPPAGYTIDTVNNFIRLTAETSGSRTERYESFKDISDADTLAEAAYNFLQKRVAVGETYALECVLNTAIYPGQTVRVLARQTIDGYQTIDVDDDLIAMSVTTRVDVQGVSVVGLQFATVERPLDDATTAIVKSGSISRDYYTHPQPGTTDPNAIHDNVAGEISAIAEKTTPVAGDWLLLESVANSNAKRRVQAGNLPGIAPVIFRVGMTASQTITSDLDWIKVNFGTIYIDDGSHYDTTNKRWTPPAGKIMIDAVLDIYNLGQTDQIAIYKNGSRVAVVANDIDGALQKTNMSIEYVDNADGSDYYEIYNYRVSADIVIHAGPLTRFEGICFPD